MKQLFKFAILGSFIGYMLWSFINGITNDLAYKTGLKTGKYINKIIRGEE